MTNQPEPTAWQTVENSPWVGAYVDELYWLAARVVSDCEHVFTVAKPPTVAGKTYFKVDPELHHRIDSALNAAARLRAMLKPRTKSRYQSLETFEFQEARMEWLARLIDLDTIPTLMSSKVRNTLEHFDEYLDEAAMRSANGNIRRPSMIPNMVAVGDESALKAIRTPALQLAEVFPIRMYVADTRKFVNCGHKIDMGNLHSESLLVRDGLVPLMTGKLDYGYRGASVLIITDETFKETVDRS